jgi:glycerol-3-phosphate acyltransferase PlsY
VIAAAALVVAGYLVGAVPTGLVFGKLAGVDPRLVGSGRVGATNTYRALGFWPSVAVALIDAGKGAGMAYLALRFAGSELGLEAVVLATVLGQVYSVFLLAQGGRGVATTAGAAAVLWPIPLALVLLIGVGSWAWHRTNSIASLTGAAFLPIAVILVPANERHGLLALALAALIWWSHRDNLGRLRAGIEPRTGRGE